MSFIRCERPRYEQTKWLICAERIPSIPFSVCRCQMAKRSPWLFVPRDDMPCKHIHTRPLTRTLPFRPTTPSSPYVRHKPCPPCIAAHSHVEPLLSLLHHPAHVFTLARRLWASYRPLAPLLFDGTLVLVSPVEATAICRLSGLDRGTQAGRWVVSTAVSLPRIPLLLLRHA